MPQTFLLTPFRMFPSPLPYVARSPWPWPGKVVRRWTADFLYYYRFVWLNGRSDFRSSDRMQYWTRGKQCNHATWFKLRNKINRLYIIHNYMKALKNGTLAMAMSGNSVHKGNKGQSSPTPTGIESDLLLAMWTKLWDTVPQTPEAPPTGIERVVCLFQLPQTQYWCEGEELLQCSVTRTEFASFLLDPMFDEYTDPPLQYHGIDLPREVEECDPPRSWNTSSGPLS